VPVTGSLAASASNYQFTNLSSTLTFEPHINSSRKRFQADIPSPSTKTYNPLRRGLATTAAVPHQSTIHDLDKTHQE
jgi:hypothetical protein